MNNMRKLFWLLVLLPVVGYTQDKRLLKHLHSGVFYIQKVENGSVTSCSQTPGNYSITKKHFYLDTFNTHYDLQITHKNSKSTWLAEDKDNNKYLILGLSTQQGYYLTIQPIAKEEPISVLATFDLCNK